jgi:hypothetical protein
MANPKSNVFCPNCSAKNKIEQNFCRFCGFNLQATKTSLTTQLSSGENSRELKQLQLIKKFTDYGSIALTVVVSVAIAFYAYVVLTKMVFSGKRILVGLFLLSMTFQFIMDQIRRIKRKKIAEINARTDLPSKETTKLLEDKPFAPASVTEHSTQLLFTENKTRKLE